MNIKPTYTLAQFLLLACLFSLNLAGCADSPGSVVPSNVPSLTPATGIYWPTQDWRSTSPEEQGMDSGKLAQMLTAVQEQHLNLDSLLVIRNGYLVSETYFGSNQSARHELYSCTKSFISTLVGIAIDKGYIDGVNHPMIDFFPGNEFANLDPHKQAMTLGDVLTMRTGLDWQEGDAAYGALYQSPDWIKFMLDKPVSQPPGSQFNYCSGCSHLLSAAIQETTNMNTLDFAERYLFKPLGISNVRWDTDAAGIPIGGWGLQLTPRDMAKLGYLYLREGVWDGQQIISAGWVKAATQKHTDTDDNRGYGYQWWTYPSLEAYTALGRFGQTIFVIPSLDLVIVTTATNAGHDEIFQLIEQYIVPSAQISQ